MKVGIIGAGTMGSGIAQAFAQTEGYEVYLCDINEEFAANGKNKIAKGLQRLVTKGKKTQEDVDAILAKITTGVKDICTDCDLIVEAALEVMDVKKQTFKELQDIVKKEDCIFATNTSSLSITEIGAGISHPVIGMHFFNPAPVMKLVEVIRGENTTDEVNLSSQAKTDNGIINNYTIIDVWDDWPESSTTDISNAKFASMECGGFKLLKK